MKHDTSRRTLLKRAAYITPAILTLQATSSVAKAGSEKGDDWGENYGQNYGRPKRKKAKDR